MNVHVVRLVFNLKIKNNITVNFTKVYMNVNKRKRMYKRTPRTKSFSYGRNYNIKEDFMKLQTKSVKN